MIPKIKGKNVLYEFDTWWEMVDYSANGPSLIDTKGRNTRNKDRDVSFLNPKGKRDIKSFDDAYAMALNGWHAMESKLESISEPIFDVISSQVEREEFYNDVQGIGIDIANYVNNIPECWVNIEPTIVEGKGNRIIKIVYAVSFSGSVASDTIANAGAVVLSLVKLLEFAGYRVDLTVGFSCEGSNNGQFEVYTNIKKPDQSVDVGRLAYALCHPSALRVHSFSLMETLPTVALLKNFGVIPSTEKTKVGKFVSNTGSYGHPGKLSRTGDITIPGRCGYFTNAETQAWITKQLKDCGVQLKETAGKC